MATPGSIACSSARPPPAPRRFDRIRGRGLEYAGALAASVSLWAGLARFVEEPCYGNGRSHQQVRTITAAGAPTVSGGRKRRAPANAPPPAGLVATEEREARHEAVLTESLLLSAYGAWAAGRGGVVGALFDGDPDVTRRLDDALDGQDLLPAGLAAPPARATSVSRPAAISAPAAPSERAPPWTGPGDEVVSLNIGLLPSVSQTVRLKLPELQDCFDARLRVAPELAGRLAVGWAVTSGRVIHAAIVVDSTGDDLLAECVTASVRTWRFPAEVQGETETHFLFGPR